MLNERSRPIEAGAGEAAEGRPGVDGLEAVLDRHPHLKRFGPDDRRVRGGRLEYQPGTGCVLWRGWTDKDGYGRFTEAKKQVRAARWSLSQALGRPLDSDEVARHDAVCACGGGGRACVNPDHLRPGSVEDNVRDRQEHGRQAKGVRCATAKLTPTRVRWLRAVVGLGRHTVASAARLLGVDWSTADDAFKGYTWRHVE